MYKFVGYLGLFMSAFFVASGIYIAAVKLLPAPPPIFQWEFTFFEENPAVFNYLIAALLIAYGAFRFYRSMRVIRQNQL